MKQSDLDAILTPKLPEGDIILTVGQNWIVRDSQRGTFQKQEPWPRFVAKIDAPDGVACWRWKGHHDKDGYGRFSPNQIPVMAHRYAYEELVGPIPDGLQIDHLCRVRNCVNPLHLEAITNEENTNRGTNYIALNRKKTQCKRGHAYDLINSDGSRGCKTCYAFKSRKYYAKTRHGVLIEAE